MNYNFYANILENYNPSKENKEINSWKFDELIDTVYIDKNFKTYLKQLKEEGYEVNFETGDNWLTVAISDDNDSAKLYIENMGTGFNIYTVNNHYDKNDRMYPRPASPDIKEILFRFARNPKFFFGEFTRTDMQNVLEEIDLTKKPLTDEEENQKIKSYYDKKMDRYMSLIGK